MPSSALMPSSASWTDSQTTQPSAVQVAQALGATSHGSGLLVVSPDNRCIFRNRQATRLIRELQGPRLQGQAGMALPALLTSCVNDLIDLLHRHPNRGSWEQVELTRVLSAEQGLILARFYAIPAAEGEAQIDCVVGLLELLPLTEQPADTPQTHFRFSERERSCVKHLVQGMTDKEIATQLGISEYTVKAHLKQIRKKTGACNRAGIIARVLGKTECAAPADLTTKATAIAKTGLSVVNSALPAGVSQVPLNPS